MNEDKIANWRHGCPKCKQRMTLFTQAARTAEMPEMPDD